MAVFRVEKNKNYTVMSNYHLRDRDLTLKAKGLLSQMLSLPEDWDFTLKGLSIINMERVDAIRTAVLELEEKGYIIRKQGRDEKGKMTSIEYTIYELPHLQEPILGNPISVKPITDNPMLENPMQLNTKELNTKELNKDLSINQKEIEINQVNTLDEIDVTDKYLNLITDNIGFDILKLQYNQERVNEILKLLVEIIVCRKKTIRIGSEDIQADIVKKRFMKLNQFHIEYVLDCLGSNTTKIHNIKNYLLTSLYNSSSTINHYYQAEVNHDIYRRE